MTNKIGLTGSLYTIPVDPDTETYRVTSVMVAGSERTVDGTLKTDYVAEKRRWAVTWSKLTSTQRDLLMAELRRAADLEFEPYEGGTFAVKVMNASWEVLQSTDDSYVVNATLEQV